jgi:hypothetical protein
MYSGPAHLHRAEMYAQMGDRVKAAQHLRRFIDIWRDCDPALRPMREAAERRLAQLERGD